MFNSYSRAATAARRLKSAALDLSLTAAVASALGILLGMGPAAGHGPAKQISPNLQQAAPSAQSAVGELQQARALADKGETTEAETAARQFLQGHANSAEAHFLLGYILFREIQVQAGPKSAMRYSDVDTSIAHFRDDHARQSLDEFTEGAKYAKPSEFDLKIVAFDYILLDDSADADKWLTRAVQWSPGDADAWYNLGRTKYTENRFDEAIRAFQECLKLEPKNEKAEDNLGLSYDGLGRANDAQTAYKTAIEWQSGAAQKDPEPFIDLGVLYLEQNRPNDALPYLRQATQVAPQDAKAHEKLGKAYAALEQLPQAQSELEKAVFFAPNVASVHYMLGQVYRKEGMMDKAKAEFDRTAALNGAHSSDSNSKTMAAPR